MTATYKESDSYNRCEIMVGMTDSVLVDPAFYVDLVDGDTLLGPQDRYLGPRYDGPADCPQWEGSYYKCTVCVNCGGYILDHALDHLLTAGERWEQLVDPDRWMNWPWWTDPYDRESLHP